MLGYSGKNCASKFFVVVKSEHVTALGRVAQFYMRTFLRTDYPTFANQRSKDDPRLAYFAIHSSRNVQDTDSVRDIFGMFNIICNRV